ncbi:MAG: ATP-binding protein [Gemmatimonadales bacterium]
MLNQQELLRAAHRAKMAEVIARGVGHDLRNAAQMVGMVHQSLQFDPSFSPAMSEGLSSAHSTIMRQIGAMESFAPGSGRSGPVALADVVEPVVAIFARRRSGPRVEFDVQVARTLPPIHAVATDLAEGLFAVLLNSVEAMAGREAGRIVISASVSEGVVSLIVEDDGPGVASEVVPKLFHPFAVRREPTQHLGIGLAVARLLAEGNGGTLEYEPTAATSGARFVFTTRRWKSSARAITPS